MDSTQVEGQDAATNVFNGAISPDRTGRSTVIHYNVARADLAVQIHARSRRAGDVANTMIGSQRNLQTSRDGAGGFVSLDPAQCGFTEARGACRWGDYVGATPDPANDGVVWGTNMFVGVDRRFRTQNFALTAGP